MCKSVTRAPFPSLSTQLADACTDLYHSPSKSGPDRSPQRWSFSCLPNLKPARIS